MKKSLQIFTMTVVALVFTTATTSCKHATSATCDDASAATYQHAAPDFERYFQDSTLRIDYIFAGTHEAQQIYFSDAIATPCWAGRRHHLDTLPLRGNGIIEMRSAEDNTLIYTTSFSTLFQEWLDTQEALTLPKAFENTFQVPMPKEPTHVKVALLGKAGEEVVTLTHLIDPEDILIRRPNASQQAEHRYVHRGGDPATCIDVAIVAEGYTASEMEIFYADAAKAAEAILASKPFDKFRDNFNFVAIATPSAESGVSVPQHENGWRNTASMSNFSTFYSARYLTTNRMRRLYDAMVGVPFEHLVILANTETYGGGGIYNLYTLTAAHNPQFATILVHEFGHSFVGLADEYFYDDNMGYAYSHECEPWEPNITTLCDFNAKWADMVPEETPIPTTEIPTDKEAKNTVIGVYEGAGYVSKGVYRPVDECLMRVLSQPFCPVCQRAAERLIRFYIE